jgi:N6-adenosine-specific RNA methylase IME4
MIALPGGKFGAILADPPWHFEVWSLKNTGSARHPSTHYPTMTLEDIEALPVGDLAADDCVLFLWVSWPMLLHALGVIDAWGFMFKTCAFAWIKADVSTLNLFPGPVDADMRLGYWTRANSEVCLLATRGNPKRLDAGVRQGIIEPGREHSRKPDCVHERIERLVAGPYLELFARQRKPGWISWGNEVDRFQPTPSEWESMWAKPFDNPELVFGNDDLAEP